MGSLIDHITRQNLVIKDINCILCTLSCSYHILMSSDLLLNRCTVQQRAGNLLVNLIINFKKHFFVEYNFHSNIE